MAFHSSCTTILKSKWSSAQSVTVPCIAVSHNREIAYPRITPFNPPKTYPESVYPDCPLDPNNLVYGRVRDLFRLLKLDQKHYGTHKWNPLGDFIRYGQIVAIKPNFVQDVPLTIANGVVVHGSILRPLIDYCYKAVGPDGEITIIDGPNGLAHFEEILKLTGTLKMVQYLRRKYQVPVRIVDLRDHYYEEEGLYWRTRRRLPGDPKGYALINLGANSHLEPVSRFSKSFRSHDIRENDPPKHHRLGYHEYSISKTLLNADFIINVSKLKTNVSCGPTLCLKNNVGITNRKNWLPHYRLGSYPYGDASPSHAKLSPLNRILDLGFRYLYQLDTFIRPLLGLGSLIVGPTRRRRAAASGIKSEKPIDFGCWHENDTIWRTVIDLNQILLYCSKQGELKSVPQRKYFCIVDGIVAGEGEGPIWITPRHSGVLIAGIDPVATDAIAAQIMGFVPSMVKIISEASKLKTRQLGTNILSSIEVASNVAKPLQNLHFTPPRGWASRLV